MRSLLLFLLSACSIPVTVEPNPPVVIVQPPVDPPKPPEPPVVVDPPQPPVTPPEPPVVVPEMTEVCFTWDRNPEPYVAGYRFYHGNAPADYADVEDVTDIEHCIENVPRGVLLYASVTAVGTSGLESPLSAELPFRGKYDLTKWKFNEQVFVGEEMVTYSFVTPRGAVMANFIEPMVSETLMGFTVMTETPEITQREDGTDLVTVTTPKNGADKKFFRLGFRAY